MSNIPTYPNYNHCRSQINVGCRWFNQATKASKTRTWSWEMGDKLVPGIIGRFQSQDATGTLWKNIEATSAPLVGYTPTRNYVFRSHYIHHLWPDLVVNGCFHFRQDTHRERYFTCTTQKTWAQNPYIRRIGFREFAGNHGFPHQFQFSLHPLLEQMGISSLILISMVFTHTTPVTIILHHNIYMYIYISIHIYIYI